MVIIAQDRLTRSFLGAQLKEEGFEVTGSATITGAILQLRELGIRPALIIIDTLEQHFAPETTELLGKICSGTPLLLIHGACDYPSQLKWQAERYELAKPLTIGQIVDKVKELRPRSNRQDNK